MSKVRTFFSRIVWVLGLVSLFFIGYVGTYIFVKNFIIQPFEIKIGNSAHPIRPVYNRVFYPLRLQAAQISFHKSGNLKKTHTGYLNKATNPIFMTSNLRSAVMETTPGDPEPLRIKFTANPIKLAQYDEVASGSFVRLTLESALSDHSDELVSKLIAVQIINKLDDPRIIERPFSASEEAALQQSLDALSETETNCAQSFFSNYKESVLEHCLQVGYANNIAGGCYHILVNSVTATVKEEALNVCRSQIK